MEAMGEMGLFCIAQVSHVRPYTILPIHLPPSLTHLCFQAMVMMKGLMGWCLNHKTTLDRVRARANETEDELNNLKAWKIGMEKARKELEEHMETLRKVLEDKEKEIKDAKDQLLKQRRLRSVNIVILTPY